MTVEPQSTINPKSWVSSTARYTGYVWYKSRIAGEELLPRGSSWLYWALCPLTWTFKVALGVDIEAFLLQRHLIIDHLCRKTIEDGQRQGQAIVEVACGYSGRGLRLMAPDKADLICLELDLPEVIARKSQLAAWRNRPFSDRHKLIPCDILAMSGPWQLEQILRQYIPPDYHVTIITEGLVHYFDFEVISGFWQRLATLAAEFEGLTYLCDLVPRDRHHPRMKGAMSMARFISAYARTKVPLHFEDEADIQSYFKKSGFSQVEVINPKDYCQDLPERAREQQPLLRVLNAQA